MNEDGQVLDGSSILLGSSLSLNLSFQMKNMTSGLPSPSNKVYCVLGCKPHSLVKPKITDSKRQSRLRKQEDEMDDTMELNKKLFRYVTGSVETEGQCRRRDNDRFIVTEYVRFELNERGQGFSTCFLDTSILPVGAYKITWHSGYVDSEGSYRSLLPVNAGPSIIVKVVYRLLNEFSKR